MHKLFSDVFCKDQDNTSVNRNDAYIAYCQDYWDFNFGDYPHPTYILHEEPDVALFTTGCPTDWEDMREKNSASFTTAQVENTWSRMEHLYPNCFKHINIVQVISQGSVNAQALLHKLEQELNDEDFYDFMHGSLRITPKIEGILKPFFGLKQNEDLPHKKIFEQKENKKSF